MASPYKTNASGFKRGSHVAGPLKNPIRYQNENRADISGLAHAVEPEQVISMRDFVNASEYAAGDWTITASGTGSVSVLASEPNGALAIVTGATSTNSESFQNSSAPWRASVIGCDLWWRSRLKVDASPTTVDLLAGLAAVSTTPLSAARIAFRVANGSATLNAEVNDGTTTQSIPTAYSIAANSYVELSWKAICGPEGIASVIFYVNNSYAAQVAVNIPASSIPLTQTMLIKTNSAAARTLTVDSLLTAQGRNA